MKSGRVVSLAALLLVGGLGVSLGSAPASAQISIGIGLPQVVVEPYYFSTRPCVDCWQGRYNGRDGYHRGGGRPWEHQRAQWDAPYRGRRHWHEGHWVDQVSHRGRQFGGRWEEGYWHQGREHRPGYGR